MADDGLYAAMVRRGMTRRSFLRFSAAMAAALALPVTYAPRIAEAVENARRIPVIWIRGQACGGDTEAFLRSSDPTTDSLLLDVLSVEYHESLLAVAGADADLARTNAMSLYPNGYFAVIEGAIPNGAGGAYCLVGGRPVADVAREVCDGALATIAVGSCAFDGGAPAANGGPTDAGGVRRVLGASRLVTLPGCPMNTVNLAAVIVHYLTFNELPPTDLANRPLAAYGNLIHNQCERRPHFEFGEFALEWGDEGAQKGWCLYKLGCKGPETMANCPAARYGAKTSWNVRSGHGCIGCTTPAFWNAMGPAYKRLPGPLPFFPALSTDTAGQLMVGAVGVAAAGHAVGMGLRMKRRRMITAREARTAAAATVAPGAADASVAIATAVAIAPAAVDAPTLVRDAPAAALEPSARPAAEPVDLPAPEPAAATDPETGAGPEDR
jgi:hydrogenase small subunit